MLAHHHKLLNLQIEASYFNHELFLRMTFFPANTLGDLMTLDSLFSNTRLFGKLGTFLDWLLVRNLDTSTIAVTLLRKRKQINVHLRIQMDTG